jgi:hypothetical protein
MAIFRRTKKVRIDADEYSRLLRISNCRLLISTAGEPPIIYTEFSSLYFAAAHGGLSPIPVVGLGTYTVAVESPYQEVRARHRADA